MNENELLEELINKHDFMVKASINKENPFHIDIDFAGRKKAYYRVVVDEDGEVYGVAYWSDLMIDMNESGESEGFEEFIPLKRTTIRLYILCDVYRQCREMDLSYEIIRFFNSNGDIVEFMDLIDLQLDENEIEVEQALEQCISNVLNQSFPFEKMNKALETDGLLNEFNILKATLI